MIFASKKSCAFFDIDGTLVEGFMIQSFPRFLVREGIIEDTYPNKIDKIISDYMSGKISYREAAEVVPHLYASALKGRQISKVKFLAKKFILSHLPEHIFLYSKQLVCEVSRIMLAS